VDGVRPGGRRSYWLREALADDPGEPCPPLAGGTEADVLVLGGGFTGMWTAYFVTEREPEARVVVLEQDICGGGPSGRNGGFVTSWWDELPDLVSAHGDAGALAVCRAGDDTVRSIGEWCARHGVDAWFTPAGYLAVASSPAQEGAWLQSTADAARLGVAGAWTPLTADEVHARCASPAFGGGAFSPGGAIVQPARLARGLRRVLLERGVRIYEGTPVRRFRAGPPAEAETPGGIVRSPRAVIATGAWTGGWPAFRRSLVTFTSYIVLTAPAPERLAEIGWTAGEGIADVRFSLHYFRTTPDGRIAFGGGGGRVADAAAVGPRFTEDAESADRAAAGLRRLFPNFDSVPIEDAWGGPIDVSPTHRPFFGTLPSGNAHYGLGYTGNGVGPCHLGGRILSALTLGIEDDTTALPFVRPEPRRFPPEPIRTIGAHVAREALVRADAAADAGRSLGRAMGFAASLPRRFGYPIGPEP
jgi:glycine/D-amino acid oxidase-like deaminating enzyme